MPPRKKAAPKDTADVSTPKARATKATKAKAAAADPVLEEVIKDASPADNDLELMLEEYEEVKARYAEPAEVKARREELRDKIASILASDGPRYYLDPQGNKAYAWQTTPETVDLDVEKLMELDEAGKIPVELLDKVAPRQLSRPGLRSAIATGALTPEQIKQIATVRNQTPRVYTKSMADEE